jgi:phosphate-selective porin OprO/OprP
MTTGSTLGFRRRCRFAAALVAVCVGSALASAPGQSAATDFIPDEGKTTDDEVAVPSLLGGSVANTDNATTDVPLGHRFVDWLWETPRLVENPEAPVLQRLRIIGRYHGQYAYVDSNQNGYSEWEARRVRLGFNARFFKHFTMQSVWKADGDEFKIDSSNVDNQWIAWRRKDYFGLKLGQQKPLWSQEWSTSSNAMLTMERSLLVNQLRPRHSLGLYASGEVGSWAYGLGGFRGEIGTDDDGEEGYFGLLSVAREFNDWFGWLDDARWRVDYLFNDASQQAAGEYESAFATSVSGKLGRGRLVSEVLYATGGGDDAYGFTITPSIDIIPDKLQFVLRYHHAWSTGDILKLQDRYETAGGVIGDGRGDRYNAIYGGLNWYLRGNKFKFMSGVEYAEMSDPNHNGGDYKGWSFIGGVRISF